MFRPIRDITLLLAAGFILNVAVALVVWHFAGRRVTWATWPLVGRQVETRWPKEFAGWLPPAKRTVQRRPAFASLGVVITETVGWKESFAYDDYFERNAKGESNLTSESACVVSVSVGFPFRSLRIDGLNHTMGSGFSPVGLSPVLARWEELRPLNAGLVLRKYPDSTGGGEYRIPAFPHLSGLAGGSIFWGAAVGAVVVGARALVRRRRVRRGLCVRCRYPVADLEICPECGSTRGTLVAQTSERVE